MNDNLLRKAVDARLSGLTFTPQMQADTLRRTHPAGSTRMGRKLSYSLAFALLALLLALLLAATAGAAAYSACCISTASRKTTPSISGISCPSASG